MKTEPILFTHEQAASLERAFVPPPHPAEPRVTGDLGTLAPAATIAKLMAELTWVDPRDFIVETHADWPGAALITMRTVPGWTISLEYHYPEAERLLRSLNVWAEPVDRETLAVYPQGS